VTPRATVVEAVSYQDLYARWEQGNWSATAIDFARDRKDWRSRFSELQRRAALWNYSLFLHGEAAVADNLSPFIDAAPREEQRYFLATQQADEARHAVFFARFMSEVVELGGDVPAWLAATRPALTWGFRQVFDRLERVTDELRGDRSRPKLAQAIALYHLIIEGVLAQPGQHFIEGYLDEAELLPGFRAGMRNIALDEQRHIAFGVKMLYELVRADPECKPAVEELLREVIRWTPAVFVPPGWDERYVTCFGFTLAEVYEEGTRSMESRLRAAGLEPESLRIGVPFDLPVAERVRRGLVMLRAGYIGEGNGSFRTDPDATAILFDELRRQLDPARVGRGRGTIQWEFLDAEPWHLRLEGGTARVEGGRLEDPDLVLRCRLRDWVDLAAGRIDPLRALALRQIRLSGSPRMLVRAARMLA
jgi:ribonucleotide reductase small subunit/SCP-2 sterol transfer family protein